MTKRRTWPTGAVRLSRDEFQDIYRLICSTAAGQLAVQITKHLGAQRIVAAGRNRVVLETLKELGAEALVPLDQEHTSLVAAIRRESAQARIDVVLDYLWGAPAKAVLEATWGKGLERAPSRTRFVQVGESGGPSISLPAAILRSSGIELMGSGFVSASMEELFKALAEFLLLAAKSSPRINIKSVPLKTWKASGPLLKKARA